MNGDRARILAQSLSETFNALAKLAYPERFGELEDADWLVLHAHILQVRDGLDDLPKIPSQLKLNDLCSILPALETAVARPESAEQRAHAVRLARQYIDAVDLDAFGGR